MLLRMTKSVRRVSLFTALIASVSVSAAGILRAEPPPPAQQGGATMAVDFLAFGVSGQQVADLKPEEVAIRVGGKARTITSLNFIKTEPGGAAAASAVPPPFAVNTVANGRQLLIVVDNESLKVGTERAVRESLDAVLSQLGANDKVAFSVAPRDTVQLGFNSGVAAVRAAVQKVTGVRPASVTDAENQCRSRDSLQLLRSLMD